MALPGELEHALLFNAVTFQKHISQEELHLTAIAPFGDVCLRSPDFQFSYSQYYAPEMGDALVKTFVVYRSFFNVEDAVNAKLKAIEIEQQNAVDGKRTINIDPGYLTLAKLVLMTTKNYDHRVHVGKGIYGDVQLRYRKGALHSNPWTYPDYKDDRSLAFLIEARSYLHKLVKGL